MSNLNFLIEIRPRLQSVNVLVNLRLNKAPNIYLSKDGCIIFITTSTVTYKIPCKKLYCDSLNGVDITDESLSFRFSTTNTDFGSFKSELLTSENVTDNDDRLNKFVFTDNCKLKIECRNCCNIFCEKLFKRVLPLPSNDNGCTDWFCHAADVSSSDPGEDDLFYLICYCHLNSKNLTGLYTRKNLICSRCLACVGIVINENCYRIWFNTVRMSDDRGLIKAWGTTGLNDVCLTIRNILKDSLLTSTRIIFKSSNHDDQMDYLLVWVVERKLNILLNSDSNDEGYEDLSVAKVLYKFSSDTTSDTIMQWSNDVTVSNIDISKTMMSQVLKHLYKMNKLLPTKWNFTNDFYVSYLPLYDIDE